MNGFRCKVKNGVATSSYPTAAEPHRNAIKGAVQPLYWANDVSNIGYTPDWDTKPVRVSPLIGSFASKENGSN